MVEAKREWNSFAKKNARRYILGSEMPEDDFDRSGRLEMSELLSDLPPNISEWIVLDIGCGIGRLEKFLSDKFKEVHGVDVSGEMIKKGKDRLKNYLNVFLKESNGKDLSMFGDCKFDLVFSVGVFQHIPRNIVFNNYFKEANRVLKSGGYFAFSVPSRQMLFRKPKLLLKVLAVSYLLEKRRFVLSVPEGELPNNNCYSSRFFGKGELERALKRNGFGELTFRNKVLLNDGQFWVYSRKID